MTYPDKLESRTRLPSTVSSGDAPTFGGPVILRQASVKFLREPLTSQLAHSRAQKKYPDFVQLAILLDFSIGYEFGVTQNSESRINLRNENLDGCCL